MFEKIPTVARLYEVAKKYKPSKEVYPLGYRPFDTRMDGGAREGELITVSGSTGDGKTTWLQNLTVNFHNLSIPSLWFSYEMDPFYLAEGFKKMKVDLYSLLAYTPIKLISGEMDFIEQEIKEAVETKAVKVVIIDHLHYLLDLKKTFNASLLIGAKVRELKQMAIRNKVIIFLIAHTRKINTGDSLNLSSVRDSGLVVCESDYVFLVERGRKKRSPREIMSSDWKTTGDILLNKSKVTLAKNRKTGKLIYVDFNVKDGKFVEITKDYNEQA